MHFSIFGDHGKKTMTFLYTVRGTYDKYYDEGGMSWEKYINWSRLTQLTELVSLDGMLNELLVEPDRNEASDWEFIVIDDFYETGFYTSLEYVFRRTKKREKFNLLMVVIEPTEDCSLVGVDGYDFMGYDLLDRDYGTSALTNCGGFDETFLPTDLNPFGLIDDYTMAYDIKKSLHENNPNEHHADTNVIAIWRHQVIGR